MVTNQCMDIRMSSLYIAYSLFNHSLFYTGTVFTLLLVYIIQIAQFFKVSKGKDLHKVVCLLLVVLLLQVTIMSLINSRATKTILLTLIVGSFAYIGIVLLAWVLLGLFHPYVSI